MDITPKRQKVQSDKSYPVYKPTNIAPPTKKKSGSRWIFWVSLVFFFAAVALSIGLFATKVNKTFETISDTNASHSFVQTAINIVSPQPYKTLKGFDEGRINILLLGRANTHKSGKNLTDTIMLASINTKDYTVGLFSIPRDFLIDTGNGFVKINSLYQTGLRNGVGTTYINKAVEDITGQKVHYYIVLDFEGFTKIIDTLGGINVDVPRHIKDERYPGPGYTYETFEIFPGLQKLDGATALKYARTRHDDKQGDFGRARRQQQVMLAARNKAFSLGTILNPHKINELFTILGDHVHTNIAPNEIEPFIALIKKVDTQNISNVVIDAWQPDSLLISARFYGNSGGISGLVPRIGNYRQIRELAQNIFTLDEITKRKQEIIDENASITLINTTKDPRITQRVKKSLTSLGFDTITIAHKTLPTQKTTTVIDHTSGAKPFSFDELLKKLPAQKSDTTIEVPKETDFIVVLGDDIAQIYKYDEISREELEQDNAKNADK